MFKPSTEPVEARQVIAFGELLMRLDCPGHQRFVQAGSYDVAFSGGEANVAIALTQWGVPAAIVSKVPTHDIGQACVNHFSRFGIDTTHVARGGDRLALLFVERGARQRGTRVIYDRLDTSFRQLTPDDVDWESVLANASWLHVTGTALVSENSRRVLLEGVHLAAEFGVPVSFDVSYRPSLWDIESAKSAYNTLTGNVDLLIGSEQDAQTFFDVTSTGEQSLFDVQAAFECQSVAFTERTIDDAGRNTYSAMLLTDDQLVTSERYPTADIDRIGTGDAFAAGLIYGSLNNLRAQETLDIAVAAAVLKHTIPGDFALLSMNEIMSFLAGGSGRIQR